MKKFLAILLAVLLAVVSVSAFAEETSPETVQESVVMQGLKNGRYVSLDFAVEEASEAFASVKGYALHVAGQLAGAPRAEYSIIKDADVLSHAALTLKDGRIYMESSALGEDVYSLSTATLVEMAINAINALDIDMGTVLSLISAATEGKDELNLYDAMPDMSSLDITPMLPAALALYSKTAIRDVANYELAEGNGDIDEEATAETAASEEEEDYFEEEEEVDNTVAMTMTCVLDHETLYIVNNCIAATIAANPQLEIAVGVDAETCTEIGEAIIEQLGEAVCVTANLDPEGNPIYGCIDFSLVNDDEIATAYCAEARIQRGDFRNELIVTVSTSDDTTEETTQLFGLDIEMLDNGENQSACLTMDIGNPNTNAFGIAATGSIEDGNVEFSFNTSVTTDGESAIPFMIQGNCAAAAEGEDYSYTGKVSLIQNFDQAQEITPDLTIGFSLASSSPVEPEFDNAIALDELDADAQEVLTDVTAAEVNETVDEIAEDITPEA